MHHTSATPASRRWLLLGSTAVGLAALGTTQVAAGRLSVAPFAPTLETVVAHTPSVSGDGSLVAYAGAPSDLADPRDHTIYLENRVDGTVLEITPLLADVGAGDSAWPVISADTCTVTFLTQMPYDLFRDDDQGGRWDVYRQTLPRCNGTLGDIELVSASRGSGFEASAADDAVPTDRPAVSADGTVVAYTRRFSVAAPELTGVVVVDLAIPIGDEGRTTPVAGTPIGSPESAFLHRGLHQPAISADGTVVAYTSDADSAAGEPQWGSGPVPGGHATTHVYAWDRANPDRSTSVRAVSSSGGADTGNADSPAVSGDGQFVAFVSTATDLVPGAVLPVCAPACVPQVYLFGRADGVVRLVSRAPGDPAAPPVAADAGAIQPALGHADGEVLFVTRATNLFPTRSSVVGGPTDGDIAVAYPLTGEVRRVSVLADGLTPAPAANSHPSMSANGRVVAFDTLSGTSFGGAAVEGRQVAIFDRAPLVEVADLDVGTVAVYYPGPEWYLVLTNHGQSSFVPATVVADNPDFLVSGGTCVDDAGVPVPPGGRCTVHLMLMPSSSGPRTSVLTIAEAGFGAVSVTADLSGIGGEPTLSPSPSGAHGGSLVVGQTGEPMSFALENVAFASVRITSLALAGEHPQDFTISADECTTVKRIPAGTTCALVVDFHPSAAGRRTATLVASTSDGIYATILLSGDAFYSPTLATSQAAVLVGSRFVVTGQGFTPNAAVTIGWADGTGQSLTVTTDAAGVLLATIPVRATDRTGERTLVAQVPGGEVATVAVKVVPKGVKLGPGSPAWPGA
ncbi:MAG: choice-of-anchor D domain-containing protein [Actinomycetota bacterium]|nr:choice-of-anchor D domain-containing protein [Actinomycetota bacterium]